MGRNYKPAVFQPTVRPSWAGTLSYISVEERSCILEAIIRFPEEVEINSSFWKDTILPDLQIQYNKFIETCNARGRGARTYWGEHKLSLSNTQGEHMYTLLKDKDKDKDIIFSLFIDLVISCFEPDIKTQEQKAIWLYNNADCLHDIFDYCNKDIELSIIAINKCFAPLKREGMNYSYRAVARNISMYHSQAIKVKESGKSITFTKEQKEMIDSALNGEKL